MKSSELENSFQKSQSIQSNNVARNDRVWKPILATFIAALGPLSFGYSLAYSSSAVVDLEELDEDASVRLTSQQASWFSVSQKLNFSHVISTHKNQGKLKFTNSWEGFVSPIRGSFTIHEKAKLTCPKEFPSVLSFKIRSCMIHPRRPRGSQFRRDENRDWRKVFE